MEDLRISFRVFDGNDYCALILVGQREAPLHAASRSWHFPTQSPLPLSKLVCLVLQSTSAKFSTTSTAFLRNNRAQSLATATDFVRTVHLHIFGARQSLIRQPFGQISLQNAGLALQASPWNAVSSCSVSGLLAHSLFLSLMIFTYTSLASSRSLHLFGLIKSRNALRTPAARLHSHRLISPSPALVAVLDSKTRVAASMPVIRKPLLRQLPHLCLDPPCLPTVSQRTRAPSFARRSGGGHWRRCFPRSSEPRVWRSSRPQLALVAKQMPRSPA